MELLAEALYKKLLRLRICLVSGVARACPKKF
jgi:hypothetical protein